MNIFIIPSEYPNSRSSLAGIFTKEQAKAIAKLGNNKVYVSSWGHDDTYLPVKKPWLWFGAIYNYLNNRKEKILSEFDGGFNEVKKYQLHWNRLIPFGGAHQLIDINIDNLKNAIRVSGKIDVIHAHFSYPAGYIAYELSKKFEIPYIITEHMSPFPFDELKENGEIIYEMDFALKHSSNIIAVSPSLQKTIENFGYKNLLFIPNIVDENKFFPNLKLEKNEDYGVVNILCICMMVQQKGVDLLIEAIAKLDHDKRKYKITIAGDGPLLKEYKELAVKRNVEKYINWLGEINREEAANNFRECDLFVLPSRHETFGIVYAEAIASGKPIIATRCGGPECIANEVNGLLINVDDVVALAEAIDDMSGNLAQYKSDEIRDDFMNRFSSRAVVDKIQNVYQRVVGEIK